MLTRDEDGRISFRKATSSPDENLRLANFWHLFVRHTSTVEPLASIRSALRIMAHRGFRHLPVIEVSRSGTNQLLGIVSAQDMIYLINSTLGKKRQLHDGTNLLSALGDNVSAIMTRNPITILDNQTLFDVIEIMSRKNIGALPIVVKADERKNLLATANPELAGIITLRDLVSLLAAFAPFGIRVEECMSREVITSEGSDTISHVIGLMSVNRVRRLPIVQAKSRRVTGMVTNKMILRYLESSLSYGSTPNIAINDVFERPVKEIMISPMADIDPKEDCGNAAYLMRELGTGGFAVSDGQGLIGVITERDLIKQIYDKQGISFFANLVSKLQSIYV